MGDYSGLVRSKPRADHGVANAVGKFRRQQVWLDEQEHHEHENNDAREARTQAQAHDRASPGGGQVLESVLGEGILMMLACGAYRSTFSLTAPAQLDRRHRG